MHCGISAWIHRSAIAVAVLLTRPGPGVRALASRDGGAQEVAGEGRLLVVARPGAAFDALTGRMEQSAASRQPKPWCRRARSGRVRDAAQPRQRHGERVGPRPAGGQVQRRPAGGAGEPAGQREQGPPQGLGDGLLVADAQAEGGDPADEVVGQGGGQQPRAVGGELPGGQLGQAGAALRSRMASSQTAWRRWSASSQVMVPGRSVTKA
jgi:hypothetical protein